jgi:hypothetical protein
MCYGCAGGTPVPPTDSTAATETYRPSGRIHLERSIKAWGILFACAVALASWQRDNIEGFGSFPFITSGLFGLVGFGLAWLAVRYGACRNPRVAALLGLAVGSIAFFGNYHVDQVRRWGAGWAELDRLPGYILFRLDTDQLQKDDSGFNRIAATPAPEIVPSRPLSMPDRWTWALFAFDALFLVGLPTLAARFAARQPYDEARGIWLSGQSAYIAPGEEPGFLAALAEGRLGDWAEQLKYKPAVHQSDALLRVWYVADLNGWAVPGHVAYVAFTDGPRWLVPAGQTFALSELSAQLRTLATSPSEAVEPVAATGNEISADVMTAVTLPDDWMANLGGLRHRLITGLLVNVFANVPYLTAVLGTVAVFFLLTGKGGWNDPKLRVVLGCAAMAGFALFYLAWFRWSLTNPWANVLRYQSARLREAIAKRSEVAVDLDNARVLLVQFWLPVVDGEVLARPAWELGYLLLDDDGGAALFEGDGHRAVIPAGAVAGFDSRLEPQMSMEGSAVYVLSVLARSDAGDINIGVVAEQGIDGSSYLDRGEALRVRWQHLADGKPISV